MSTTESSDLTRRNIKYYLKSILKKVYIYMRGELTLLRGTSLLTRRDLPKQGWKFSMCKRSIGRAISASRVE